MNKKTAIPALALLLAADEHTGDIGTLNKETVGKAFPALQFWCRVTVSQCGLAPLAVSPGFQP